MDVQLVHSSRWPLQLVRRTPAPAHGYILWKHLIFMDETTTAPSADNAAAWVDSKEMATRAAAKIMEEATA
jgi:hypothetical protein